MTEPAVSLDDVGFQDLRAVADRLLETTRVEYVDEGVLLVMNPPGIQHRRIVRSIVDDAKRAFYTGACPLNWATDENYQWDLPDGSGRFYVPDLAFIHPGATTAEEEKAAALAAQKAAKEAEKQRLAEEKAAKKAGKADPAAVAIQAPAAPPAPEAATQTASEESGVMSKMKKRLLGMFGG